GSAGGEVIRSVSRSIAREIFGLLTKDPHGPDTTDLRPTRHAAGITLQNAADHLNTWPARISELERGLRRNDELEHRYRDWLTTQIAA
ncbi:MAG TPA: hypothetical protein PKA24_17510, partial [Microthrixaceae bacterium]|nr:hypothetical protein [Microthrixaceae bacterium]